MAGVDTVVEHYGLYSFSVNHLAGFDSTSGRETLGTVKFLKSILHRDHVDALAHSET